MKRILIPLLILLAILFSACAIAETAEEPCVHGVGVLLQKLEHTDSIGSPVSDLPVGNSVDFRAESGAKKAADIDYWVIDGVIYHLNMQQTSITVRRLTRSMTIECVLKGEESKTAAVHSHETDEPLTVQTINAKMCFLKKLAFTTSAGAGGYFKEFDFSRDYVNRATGKQETGGRITVRVTANVPKGMHINYWLFNDVRFYLNKNTCFIAEELSDNMVYQPVLGGSGTVTEEEGPAITPPGQIVTITTTEGYIPPVNPNPPVIN